MNVRERIQVKLAAAFAPERLEIVDESALHAGHAGARPGGESHFRVSVVADAFAGLSRVQRQRRVYEVLVEELSGPVHALSLRLQTPGEVSDE